MKNKSNVPTDQNIKKEESKGKKSSAIKAIDIWRITRKDWKEIPNDTLDFAIELAQEKLTAIIKVGDKLTTRAYTLLSLYGTILTVIITFLASGIESKTPIDQTPTIILILVTLPVVAFNLFQIIRLISPFKTQFEGRNPSDLLIDSFLDLESSIQLTAIKINEIEIIEYKIGFNNVQNQKRNKRFRRIVTSSAIILLIDLILILIFYFVWRI